MDRSGWRAVLCLPAFSKHVFRVDFSISCCVCLETVSLYFFAGQPLCSICWTTATIPSTAKLYQKTCSSHSPSCASESKTFSLRAPARGKTAKLLCTSHPPNYNMYIVFFVPVFKPTVKKSWLLWGGTMGPCFGGLSWAILRSGLYPRIMYGQIYTIELRKSQSAKQSQLGGWVDLLSVELIGVSLDNKAASWSGPTGLSCIGDEGWRASAARQNKK